MKYVQSDAEPAADTFIGHVARGPADVVAEAIARAHAARAALRELDGQLPEQPLAVTVRRGHDGAVAVPSALDVAAFTVGDHCVRARLAGDVGDEAELARTLTAVLAGARPPIAALATPFVAVALGDDPIATARHGHRRAWQRNGVAEGPWLGLGRAGALATVSTCHMIVDGYGHAWLAARIAAHAERLAPRAPATGVTVAPALAPIAGAVPLDVAWQPLAASPRALALAYALGRLLHHTTGRRQSLQIPIAPGAAGDPLRRLRRVVPAIATVRFDGATAEPFATFAARTKLRIDREIAGTGMVSRLLAAAARAPAPLAWKRRLIGTERPAWVEPFADLLGGRGCASRIRMSEASPPACAVSSPPSRSGLVATVIDDGERAAITLCGAGACDGLVAELISLFPRDQPM